MNSRTPSSKEFRTGGPSMGRSFRATATISVLYVFVLSMHSGQ